MIAAQRIPAISDGCLSLAPLPRAVLPDVNIPVVTVVWTDTRLDTPDMESRVTTYAETSLGNYVSSIRFSTSAELRDGLRGGGGRAVLKLPANVDDGRKVKNFPRQRSLRR